MALTAFGCDLRKDSYPCCDYIAHDEGTVECIVHKMQEMKFENANIRERIVNELVDQNPWTW